MIRKYGLDPGTKMVDHDNKKFLKAYFATGCDSIFIPDIVKKLKKKLNWFSKKTKVSNWKIRNSHESEKMILYLRTITFCYLIEHISNYLLILYTLAETVDIGVYQPKYLLGFEVSLKFVNKINQFYGFWHILKSTYNFCLGLWLLRSKYNSLWCIQFSLEIKKRNCKSQRISKFQWNITCLNPV